MSDGLLLFVSRPPVPLSTCSPEQLASENIMVGDIVRLTENEEIPCDLVLLSCSDPLGNCFIQVRVCSGV
jgi:magnesium-transporting ATPase (P-type)